MEKENKKNNLIIILLSVIVLLLVIICVALYLKMEHLDDKDDYNTPQINNNNYDNDYDDHDDIKYDDNYISSTEALKIALDNLNINENNIYDMSSDLDYKYGKTVYEIEFKYDRNEYEFYIDATTGEILRSFKERD